MAGVALLGPMSDGGSEAGATIRSKDGRAHSEWTGGSIWDLYS